MAFKKYLKCVNECVRVRNVYLSDILLEIGNILRALIHLL